MADHVLRSREVFHWVPCHNGDRDGMTKVHCSSRGKLVLQRIHLRDLDSVDIQWYSQMNNWLMCSSIISDLSGSGS